jgi:hypothetical protein
MAWGRTAAVVLAASALPAMADARPRRGYIPIQLPAPAAGRAQAAFAGADGPPGIIYLNRCAAGCTITPGDDDSRVNTSSIIDRTIRVSAFDKGDAEWQEVVRCVQRVYQPFNIRVVDQDPGAVPHHEAIVAGEPVESGFPEEYGGVAPSACTEIPNSITYSFANVWYSALDICETVAQETAHAFGLDHAMLCDDPMSYLAPCGPRSFQDEEADCGEKSARDCWCGGTTQNSFRWILDMFGPGDVVLADIVRPRDQEQVRAGFVIEADPGDAEVARVEVELDGRPIGERTGRPFVFDTPVDLAPGDVEIVVRAFDRDGIPGQNRIRVQLAPCDADAACGDDYECVAGRCVLGPGRPGGLGESCRSDAECSGELCHTLSDARVCSASCDRANDDCPSGFACSDSDPTPVCVPARSGACGTIPDGAGSGPAGLGLLVAALGLLAIRRRARHG